MTEPECPACRNEWPPSVPWIHMLCEKHRLQVYEALLTCLRTIKDSENDVGSDVPGGGAG